MKKYSYEFINMVISGYKKDKSANKVIEQYEISKSTLYYWLKTNKIITQHNNKIITNADYKKLLKDYNHIKLMYEIYENLHCFKDSSTHDKEIAISKFVGVYPTKLMCKILDLPHGTFYNYYFRRKKITQNQIRDEQIKTYIMDIYLKSEKRFGANKIMVKLKSYGVNTTLKKVKALMNELNIESIQKLTKKESTNPNNKYYINKLQRMFKQDKPNKFWASDVTELKVGLNKFYLCVILDLFSRKVIAYRLSCHNNTNLTINTFKDAFENRGRPNELSFHSDQGSNYTAYEFRDLLRVLKVNQSFSHAGNPYDNACMESFFSNFKREEYNSNSYDFFDDLEKSVDSYMKYYNEYRPHKTLNNISPNEFEQAFYEKKALKKP